MQNVPVFRDSHIVPFRRSPPSAHYCTALALSPPRRRWRCSPIPNSPCLGELIFLRRGGRRRHKTTKRSFPNGRTRPSSKVRTNEERQTQTEQILSSLKSALPWEGLHCFKRAHQFGVGPSLPLLSSYAPFADCHSGGASAAAATAARGWRAVSF